MRRERLDTLPEQRSGVLETFDASRCPHSFCLIDSHAEVVTREHPKVVVGRYWRSAAGVACYDLRQILSVPGRGQANCCARA